MSGVLAQLKHTFCKIMVWNTAVVQVTVAGEVVIRIVTQVHLPVACRQEQYGITITIMENFKRLTQKGVRRFPMHAFYGNK